MQPDSFAASATASPALSLFLPTVLATPPAQPPALPLRSQPSLAILAGQLVYLTPTAEPTVAQLLAQARNSGQIPMHPVPKRPRVSDGHTTQYYLDACKSTINREKNQRASAWPIHVSKTERKYAAALLEKGAGLMHIPVHQRSETVQAAFMALTGASLPVVERQSVRIFATLAQMGLSEQEIAAVTVDAIKQCHTPLIRRRMSLAQLANFAIYHGSCKIALARQTPLRDDNRRLSEGSNSIVTPPATRPLSAPVLPPQ